MAAMPNTISKCYTHICTPLFESNVIILIFLIYHVKVEIF
uniref:Uncharacterized protein n=1 Tax=Anguilla anguilla TaxID=7936 RepID=A0A0E9TAH5_ANGAN